jgi:hypothetical protein
LVRFTLRWRKARLAQLARLLPFPEASFGGNQAIACQLAYFRY